VTFSPTLDADQILERTLVLEGHRDCYEQINLLNEGVDDPLNASILPRLRSGAVDVVVYAVGGDSIAHSNGRDKRLLATIENLIALSTGVDESDGAAALVATSGDVPDAPNGRIGFVPHLEGGGPLEGSLAALEALFLLGIRSIQPAWNLRNELADGVREQATNGGLTRFGIEVLGKMEEWGLVVDLAHISPAGFWDAMRVTSKPLVVSHANSKKVYDHPRNLTDDQIIAVAERDGVIGVHALPAFVDESQPVVDRLVDHIVHMIELAGIDHVGFGGDFIRNDGPRSGREEIPVRVVEELDDFGEIDDLPHLVNGLLGRGFGEAEVGLILGRNFARVLRAALPD
jgi:membrane dipeptidase